MIKIDRLMRELACAGLESNNTWLSEAINRAFSVQSHGDLAGWLSTVDNLPKLTAREFGLDEAQVRVGPRCEDRPQQAANLYTQLQKLHPWRKGPYLIHGINIDSEWRSDLKWDRLQSRIAPLDNRNVLDVGCGNGYHCWRMVGAGAQLVIGIDPTLLSVVQFLAIQHFVGERPLFVLPLDIESIDGRISGFDTVFSMGLLYHRKSPLDHLTQLQQFLRSGGELVLETLIVDGDAGYSLLPEGRYAQMRNVWFIPSCPTLATWLQRCGYTNIRLVDITTTTIEEQRSTDWMRFHSLADFLDPSDHRFTCEGLPAPKRGIFIANKA